MYKNYYFITLAVIFLNGCATHADYLTKISIKGEVELTQNGEQVINVSVEDVNLDDNRDEQQRIIITGQAKAGEEFYFERKYFWGSSKIDPDADAKIKLELSSDGCNTIEKYFFIKELYDKSWNVILDVKAIKMECK